jgi:hypothetical protein
MSCSHCSSFIVFDHLHLQSCYTEEADESSEAEEASLAFAQERQKPKLDEMLWKEVAQESQVNSLRSPFRQPKESGEEKERSH